MLVVAKIGNRYLRLVPGAWAFPLVAATPKRQPPLRMECRRRDGRAVRGGKAMVLTEGASPTSAPRLHL